MQLYAINTAISDNRPDVSGNLVGADLQRALRCNSTDGSLQASTAQWDVAAALGISEPRAGSYAGDITGMYE